jgi:hypothetical protein
VSEEQFREQLVDYLYGELDGAQRDAFEASLAASPQRQAELEAMRETLRTARTGLAALNEEPPARLRGAILDAERASHARVLPLKPWYRRASTITPALAAAAALTFAVLAPRRDQQPRLDNEQAPAPPAAEPTAAPQGEPIVEQLVESESKGKLEAPAEKKRDVRVQRRARPELDDSKDGLSGFAPPPPGWGSGAVGRSGGGGSGDALEGVAADKPRVQAEARARREEAESSARAASATSAPAPVAAKPAKRARAPEAAPKSSADLASAEPASAEPARGPSADAGSQRAPDAMVQRAREHVSARRWSEAVIAYRELLMRFPKDERAASWRSELGDAARALTAVPP